MRPGPERRAEGAADERTDHLYVLGRKAEDGRDLGLLVDDELALAPQRQPIAVPGRDGRVRLHRIVILARDVVDLIDLHRRVRQSAVGVAARGVGRQPRIRLLSASGTTAWAFGSARIDDRPLGRVGDAQRRGGALGLVERVGDDDRDRLAVEADVVVLQHMQPLADGRIDVALVGA